MQVSIVINPNGLRQRARHSERIGILSLMNQDARAFARNMFRLQIHEAVGQRFEDLFTKIMNYKTRDFRAVKPHGNTGDRKNDGWIESKGTYFQVYAPEDTSKSILATISKLHTDFTGLYAHWNASCPVRNFYFVVNDKYRGVAPQVHAELLEIKAYGLTNAHAYTAKELERDLFALPDDEILSVVGHIPTIDSSDFMLISGFTCFITAWIDFEKTSRDEVFSRGVVNTTRPLVGSELLRKLIESEVLNPLEGMFVRNMSNVRNGLIHGATLDIPRKSDIDHLIAITEKLKAGKVNRTDQPRHSW